MAPGQGFFLELSGSSTSSTGDREREAFRELCRPLMQSIRNQFPIEPRAVVRVQQHGRSCWATTLKIDTTDPDGTRKSYFCKAFWVKTLKGSGSAAFAAGECKSAIEISRAVPGHVPHPHYWGQFLHNRDLYSYYIQDFHDMTLGGAPDPVELVGIVTRMHRETSANGAFGYCQPTVIGSMERRNSWQTSWAHAFAAHLKDAFEYDRDVNGPWRELRAVYEELVAHVVPRLLDVLQIGGRSITPALLHGDLCERNVGIDKGTGKIVLFDPGCFYGHNEMEFAAWRCSWATHFNLEDRSYLSLYEKEIPPSEPAEEWDDRNRLYSIYAYLVASGSHFGSSFRLIAKNEMICLCRMYGSEKYDMTRGKYDPDLIQSLLEDKSSGVGPSL
ncbi:hypothetical protein LLEC1_04716 [Akanthomyces lecanii]|uniref:protein-ribulosamine 3-kinase n=1 Tax=Cordyceps confragosa TaxID=2714763 RepID=A0A179IN80_CORDF|nr:hypothetical protein LLEC1_04716 [Akanthomyces lecanii]